MADFLYAALTLVVLAGLPWVLNQPAWTADSLTKLGRALLWLLASLIYLAVLLSVYAYDRQVMTAMIVGQQQQPVRPPQPPPAEKPGG